jgi:hypothetical protein
MSVPRKLLSEHSLGRGVAFDCSAWADDAPAQDQSRGNFVSIHALGQGAHFDSLPGLRLVLTLNLPTAADHELVRNKFNELGELICAIDKHIGGMGIHVDDDETGIQPDRTYRYAVTTPAADGAAERMRILANLLAVMAATVYGRHSVRAAVIVLSDPKAPLFEIAA